MRAKTVLEVLDLASGRVRRLAGEVERDNQEGFAFHGVFPGFAWTPDGRAVAVPRRTMPAKASSSATCQRTRTGSCPAGSCGWIGGGSPRSGTKTGAAINPEARSKAPSAKRGCFMPGRTE